MFVRFEGAEAHTEDDGSRIYVPKTPIWIETKAIKAFYDHTIIIGDNVLRVMETAKEIKAKVG